MTKALVPLATGVEEMEAVIIIDVLRRAGWKVTSATIEEPELTASRGVKLVADARLEDLDANTFDVLAIPGGAEGTTRLARHGAVLEAVRSFVEAGKLVGAICAGPLVLQAAGVLDGKVATCHPGVADQLTCTQRRDGRVERDGTIITSQGPGTAMEFALAILETVDGRDAAARVRAGLVL